MAEHAGISEADVDRVLVSLDEFATEEYGQDVAALFADDDPVRKTEYQSMGVRGSADAFWRVGRLVGITIKEPFATAGRIDGRPSQTGARRRWDLNHDLWYEQHPEWWQYNVLVAYLAEQPRRRELDWLPPKTMPEAEQVWRFLSEAQNERGVFRAVVKALRPVLCADPNKKSLSRISADPVQIVTVGAVTTVANQLAQEVSWLAGDSQHMVTVGISMLIVKYGVDGFCQRTVPAPEPGAVET
jgi:hypothetical protein